MLLNEKHEAELEIKSYNEYGEESITAFVSGTRKATPEEVTRIYEQMGISEKKQEERKAQ